MHRNARSMRSLVAWRASLGVTLVVIIAVLSGLLGDEEPKSSTGRAGAGEGDGEQARARGRGIVELHFMGRLGNNLFEYAVARTIADELGWALFLRAGKGNPMKFGTLLRAEGMECFPGVRALGPDTDSLGMRNLPVLENPNLREGLEWRTQPRRVVLSSWYQNYQLFAAYKDRLREIMALNKSCCGPTAPGVNDMVIHHRNYRAELTSEQYIKLHFKDLDYEYYDTILRDSATSPSGSPDTVWIVGEFDMEDALVQRLQAEHGVKIAEMVENQFHAFCFLTRAPRLVMAPSTFSWWTAFLSNATEVHYPLQTRGVTTRIIAVTDEARYVYRDATGKVLT